MQYSKRQYELKELAIERANNPRLYQGMTQEEVLIIGWGKPKDINRTTNAYGISKQWVYEGYKYLYFGNGVLNTIQD